MNDPLTSYPPFYLQATRGFLPGDMVNVTLARDGRPLNPVYAKACHAGAHVAIRVILRINFKRGGWRALLLRGAGPYPTAIILGADMLEREVPITWLRDIDDAK